MLLPTTSVLKRRVVPTTVSSFSVSATATDVSLASILLLLVWLRRYACRKKQTKMLLFRFLVAVPLLLFTHREECAEKNKIGFCFLFDTGTQSIASSVTGYVLLLFLTTPGFCLQHRYSSRERYRILFFFSTFLSWTLRRFGRLVLLLFLAVLISYL